MAGGASNRNTNFGEQNCYNNADSHLYSMRPIPDSSEKKATSFNWHCDRICTWYQLCGTVGNTQLEVAMPDVFAWNVVSISLSVEQAHIYEFSGDGLEGEAWGWILEDEQSLDGIWAPREAADAVQNVTLLTRKTCTRRDTASQPLETGHRTLRGWETKM
ncbi:hypothetical protein K491DRAFT_685200 [Lophiostoma macrostomum CBS 122681]|uniref:Uncharacterized protein n=1 Tax=Lophiostoma macrostomum CBS 122681 TaxID=1314788 RepID=A0A6A6SIZ7_9PLEO|nr:hypothetical protein K491DRAFT_685200 [Lophiostoma macrostomum CBS 122681]